MYGTSYRGEVFCKRYRELAKWVLEHQAYFDATDKDIENLMTEIDLLVDTWLGERKTNHDC